MRNRIKYSQNFLQNTELVKSLVRKSGISQSDTVLEIGAGDGIITAELLNIAGKVMAFEVDKHFFDKLEKKFEGNTSLQLRLEDFLEVDLPSYPYKVFSNIPFNLTSAIIKRLTLEDNSPEYAYLIIQKEAAMKFVGKPLDSKNSQLSVLLYPWFEIKSTYNFKPSDFHPRPNVQVVLIEIKKIQDPLINLQKRQKYEDFVTFAFNQFKPNITEGLSSVLGKQNIITLAKEHGFSPEAKPSELNFQDWISLFEAFLGMPEKQQLIVKGSFSKQLKQQESIEKVNRTRVDKNWRNYKR